MLCGMDNITCVGCFGGDRDRGTLYSSGFDKIILLRRAHGFLVS